MLYYLPGRIKGPVELTAIFKYLIANSDIELKLFPVVSICRCLAYLSILTPVMFVSGIAFAAPDSDAAYRAVPGDAEYIPAELVKRVANPRELKLRSHIGLVYDERDDVVLYEKGARQKKPIASLTKLMTAMVILDGNLDMDAVITITRADRDTIRYSRTRLPVGTSLRRSDLLLMALAASENRAAFALARTYPGGTKRFVQAMNDKAQFLGLRYTRFADSAGLRNGNVSTAEEILKLVRVASQYSLIREYSTTDKDLVVDEETGKVIRFVNTNRLVRKDTWDISLSKTGFTSDAGNCLVMKLTLGSRPLVIVLLNSWGKLSKYGDTNRIKRWLTNAERKARRMNLF